MVVIQYNTFPMFELHVGYVYKSPTPFTTLSQRLNHKITTS